MPGKSRYETLVKPHLAEIPRWFETMTEGQIAQVCGVTKKTFIEYKKKHKELCDALNRGRVDLVTELKSSLKKKALGFEFTERKITVRQDSDVKVRIVEEYTRYSPPDTGAIHLLLKNLDDDWRNDDGETVRLKREKLDVEKKKAEQENW